MTSTEPVPGDGGGPAAAPTTAPATAPATAELVADLRAALEAVADPERAEPMAAYMKHHFPFLGVPTPARRAAQKPTLDTLAGADGEAVLALAEACWREPERELQQVGADALRRFVSVLEPHQLSRVGALVTTRAWWDTVDTLAIHTVGPLVAGHSDLVAVMDRWIEDPDRWLARTAILHQLLWKADTDAQRLFRYADRRASDQDFFIRKALGWALRQYARTDPEAVWAFVDAQRDRLSALTLREAQKHR